MRSRSPGIQPKTNGCYEYALARKLSAVTVTFRRMRKRQHSPERRVIGLDASAEMLMQAAHCKQLELVQAQAEYLPFETGSFDRIFCVSTPFIIFLPSPCSYRKCGPF